MGKEPENALEKGLDLRFVDEHEHLIKTGAEGLAVTGADLADVLQKLVHLRGKKRKLRIESASF